MVNKGDQNKIKIRGSSH